MAYVSGMGGLGAVTPAAVKVIAALMPAYRVCADVTGGADANSPEFQACVQKALPQLNAGVAPQAVTDSLKAEKQGRSWVVYAGIGAFVLVGGALYLTRKKG